MKEATQKRMRGGGDAEISIHASMKEATLATQTFDLDQDFNPRLHEGGDTLV